MIYLSLMFQLASLSCMVIFHHEQILAKVQYNLDH